MYSGIGDEYKRKKLEGEEEEDKLNINGKKNRKEDEKKNDRLRKS